MERNDENTIGARLEKILMDAVAATEDTIAAAVDEKDPVRRMTVLMDGYRRAVQALLPNEDLERLHLAEKCGEPTFHTPPAIADFVLGNPPLSSIPGGADGATPGPDPAAEVAQRKSLLGVMRDKFGLDLKRFATGKVVKLVGKRRTEGGLNDCIWELDVDKASCSVEARCDGTVVYRLQGLVGGGAVEKMAVSALIRLLSERRRRHLCEKRARIRRAVAKEAE